MDFINKYLKINQIVNIGRLTLSSIFLLGTLGIQAQISLDSCINQSYRQFELQKQIDFTSQVAEANIERIKKAYLPSLELNAVSTYQNEQITIPVDIPIPGFEAPAAPLNLNNALLGIRQWIYDGSMTQQRRLMEEAQGDISLQEIEIQRLEIRTSVIQVYMSILMLERQLDIISDKEKVIEERLNEIDAAVDAQVLLESDRSLLKAERVRLKQQKAELFYARKASLSNLGQLMGMELNNDLELLAPVAQISNKTDFNNRPDIQMYDLQYNLLEAQKGMSKSTYLPKVSVFADGGLGLPGYDIFKDEIAPMFKVGLSLNWKIFDWNQGNIQRQSLSMNQEILRIRKKQTETRLSLQTSSQLNQIEKANELMLNDEEIIDLYQSVSTSYASQLENGMITSAEYIQQLNKEEEARTNFELHKIQLLIATINYNTLLGE